MTKDLHTGELSSSVGQSDTFISHTDILLNVHSDIPLPTNMGWVTMTSNIRPMPHFTTSLSPPVLESTNQYDVLHDMTDSDLDTGAAVPRIVQLAKRPASSSS